MNDTFFTGTGPVFICVGGEGPALDGSAVVSSVHCNDAVELLPSAKALMFAVEHRYYGCHNASACPYDAHDREPLKWLSSKQALADLATFHAFATKEYRLSTSTKWVSWGGSYPGMLAGWFRVMFPNLVHAAVSSSAPVAAKLHMNEYYDIASRAYSLPSVGGSATCESDIAAGHVRIGMMMQNASGRAQLASLFPEVQRHGATWLVTEQGQREFAGLGVIEFPSQSNDPACQGIDCNIERICETMLKDAATKTPLERLAVLATAARNSGPVETAVEAVEAGRAAALHSWMDYWGWQTCTEFGFYQTCDVGSDCFFTQGLVTLDVEDSFCATQWGINPSDVQAAINATNAYYGARRPDVTHNATRVLYVNGNVDPWSGLSILTSPTPALPTIMVEGASHHAWTHPAAPTDQVTVVEAKKAIHQQVMEWLAQPA